ncbi:MAG: hypothetical protein HPY45_11960 [Anaerolineae bacterium]|nr:hypothetical protein [Anaerolineae bacterium]
MKRVKQRMIALAGVLLVTLGCTLTLPGVPISSSYDLTKSASEIQATAQALQQLQATLEAASQNMSQGAPTPIASYTPLPTFTIGAPAEPAAPPTEEPPTAVPVRDMQERIRSANVLIFEDIWDDPELAGNRRVSMAVRAMGFSGGKVVNVGDALGDFKAHLNSSTPWDLIVVSAESRADVKGEFWDYMLTHVNNNVALVAEVWYLDKINLGRISPLMSQCGISLHKNWERDPAKYDQLDYSILLLDPSHPIFNTPNAGISLVTPNIHWFYDAGDLLKLGTGGDARLLAGIYQDRPSDYGVIAECMGGRVIFQTFSTHDYRQDKTVPLWQNYMTYTLTKHFEVVP